MPPPARANAFGPTMHTAPFANQHLVHGHHNPNHLSHHPMQPQHQPHQSSQHQQQQHQHQQQHQVALQQAQAQAQAQAAQHQAQAQAAQQAAVAQQAQQAAAQAAQQAAAAAAAAATAIRDVWKSNLETEIAVMRDIVDKYPYISMDTEFPGIVARPIGGFRTKADYHYQTLRCNVDMLKIIQLGITFYNEHGQVPEPVSTWQFNFQFSLTDDMYAQESIDLLTKSGIDFKRHEEYGISVASFGELLISSGLVLLDNVKWISFHSGYDFGYLVKIMLCTTLPSEEQEFRRYLNTFFPALYDIKFMMKACKGLKGGLQEVADDLAIPRLGPQHQAGSDSLLTGHIFFAMRQRFFEGKIDDEKFLHQVWGLNGVGLAPNPLATNPNAINTIGAVIYNSNGQPNSIPPPSTPTTIHPPGGPITPQQHNPYASQGQSNPITTQFGFSKMGGI